MFLVLDFLSWDNEPSQGITPDVWALVEEGNTHWELIFDSIDEPVRSMKVTVDSPQPENIVLPI